MELWRILVMGVLKQGLGCDFDRLHELVNQHRTVREFLGHGAFSQDDTYEFQTIIDNVYLLTPELLSEIGQLVVESGHAVARKKPGEPLRGRCDSFVVETDVHYPTATNIAQLPESVGESSGPQNRYHFGRHYPGLLDYCEGRTTLNPGASAPGVQQRAPQSARFTPPSSGTA